MEDAQGLSGKQLAGKRACSDVEGKGGCRGGVPWQIQNSLQTFHRVYGKQPPLNAIIDIGSTVKINFIQGSK